MARIESYNLDDSISGNDKFIGTDTTGLTKNFSLHSITNWLNDSGSVSILGQNNYFFQEQASNPNARLEGSISFENFGGAETNFSDITNLVFSSKNAAGISNEEFITGFIGKSVLLAQLDDYNNFGVYELSSFTPVVNESGFYKATLSFKNGSGFIKPSKNYGFALYEFSAQIYERASYPVVSPDGTSFIIVAGNDGTLAAIPPTSTAPSITTLPTISGTLNVGEKLTATAGNVSGVPTPTRVFQWQRSDDGTTGWADISGATGETYLLDDLDENKYIRVQQIESNVLGATIENSLATSIIGQTLFLGVLDIYQGAAAGFSLRRLTRFYEGPLIRVRRTVDNTSTDIGYDPLGNLDTAELNSFCNPGGVPTDAKLEIWYNQVAIGDDAIQSTDTKQLTIVENGSVVELNSKPAMYPPVGGISALNILPFNIVHSGTPDLSSFLVSQTSASNTFNIVADNNILTPDGIISWTSGGGNSAYRSGGSTNGNTLTQHLNTSIFSSAGYTSYQDNFFRASDTRSSMDDNWNFTFINIYSGTTDSNDRIQEVILYLANKFDQREAIENTINEYYQIY